ncbi:hypothetical protein [Porphyromonas cangingivalis]|uniref:hypothetical protein n=1 Tax=Porphyromonas cangingivalis TaxID=36874 RepID=UPI00242CB3AD|nr:hypothetical protein [Porphyromonas cangingivalis]
MKKRITTLLVLMIGLLACSEENKKEVSPSVEEESLMTFASAKVLEFRAFTNGKAQDLSLDMMKEYWGERITDNTPTELQFKKDSVYIIKPNQRIEKYKSSWRGQELFLYNDKSETWHYCGAKTKDSGFILNTGFYAMESKNEKRTLRLIGHAYSLRNHNEVGNFGKPSMVWTSMNFLFKNK